VTARHIELALLLIAALISDFRAYRIDNRIIMVFLAVGALTGFLQEGPDGLLSALLGILLPLLTLFWLYSARMLGAGDIKLFCAVGAVMGIGFIPWCIAWSFLAGGLTALALMLARRNIKQRFRYLGGYLKACFLSGSILEYSELTDKSGGAKFHFSLAVAFGTAVQVCLASFL
jgi:prepilin peptidase CpaA